MCFERVLNLKKSNTIKHLMMAAMLCVSTLVAAGDEFFSLPVEDRLGDHVPVLKNQKSNEAINLILIPGGNAGTGEIKNGLPTSQNFLVRSRGDFDSAGFNTYVLFRAKSVAPDVMSTTYRNEKAHMVEIQSLINHIKTHNKGPIWLVGTSMGTISATTAAIQLSDANLKGVVLTSSVTRQAPGHLAKQNLDQIKLPVLMIHHEADACFACIPKEAQELFKKFSNSNKKDFFMVTGGGQPSGDPCQSLHWHGFIGIEKTVTSQMIRWINSNS